MSCVNTLANITRKCGTKVAVGLESYLYIARKDEVQAIAAPGAGTLNVATITMVGGAGFRKIETALTLSKNTWNSAPNEDKDVTNHVTTVSVFHAGIGAAESYILGGTAGQDFVVVCEDRDGNKRIVGDIKTGCTVKVTEDINGDTNGYTIAVSWDSAHPPYFFTGTLTVDSGSN
jgi:hypothetical protein